MAPTYELYTYFRSSCSARVRIAASFKGIAITPHFINLLKSGQSSEEYGGVNPSESVPTLVVAEEDGQRVIIQQSIAALEYLEESRPDLAQLLPSSARERAAVRQLVNIVASDIQPVTNLRVLQQVKKLGAEASQWQREWMLRGLLAYEKTMVRQGVGKYSYGASITMADVVLAPAVDGALRFGVDLEQMPNVQRVYAELQQLPALKLGSWRAQPDTPKEFRVREGGV